MLSKSTVFLFVIGFVQVTLGLERPKRGASVYPVFGGGGSGHGEQNNFLFQHDASPFINYLGGSGGSTPTYGGNTGSQYSNLQAHPRSGYDGTSGGPLDSNHLNTFNQSPYSGSGGGRRPSSSSGWQPAGSSGSVGYGGASGGFYTSGYGHLSANFANSGGSGHGGGASPRPQRHSLPTLDAHVLLQSATTSFNAQNHVLSVLNSAGPPPRSYKGGL